MQSHDYTNFYQDFKINAILLHTKMFLNIVQLICQSLYLEILNKKRKVFMVCK